MNTVIKLILITLFISYQVNAEEGFPCKYTCHIGYQKREGPHNQVKYYTANTLTMSEATDYISVFTTEEVDAIKNNPKKQKEIEKELNDKVIARCNQNLINQHNKLPTERIMAHDNIIFAFRYGLGNHLKDRKCIDPNLNIESPNIQNDVYSYFCSSKELMLIEPKANSGINYNKEDYYAYSRPLSIGKSCIEALFTSAEEQKNPQNKLVSIKPKTNNTQGTN